MNSTRSQTSHRCHHVASELLQADTDGGQNLKKLIGIRIHLWNDCECSIENPNPGPRTSTKNPMSIAHPCRSLNSNQFPIWQFIHFIHKHYIVTLAGQWASSLAHLILHLRCDETWIGVAFQRHTNWLTKRKRNGFVQEKQTLSVFSCGNPGGFRKRLNIKLKGNYYRSTTCFIEFCKGGRAHGISWTLIPTRGENNESDDGRIPKYLFATLSWLVSANFLRQDILSTPTEFGEAWRASSIRMAKHNCTPVLITTRWTYHFYNSI